MFVHIVSMLCILHTLRGVGEGTGDRLENAVLFHSPSDQIIAGWSLDQGFLRTMVHLLINADPSVVLTS